MATRFKFVLQEDAPAQPAGKLGVVLETETGDQDALDLARVLRRPIRYALCETGAAWKVAQPDGSCAVSAP